MNELDTSTASPELTAEQKRRIEIFESYNQIAGPVRETRNQAIEAFDRDWREKAILEFQEQESQRIERLNELTAQGVARPVATTQIAFEVARKTEDRLIERDTAARKLDESLAQPLRWRDYLGQEAERNPGDPVIASLLTEHSALDHEATIDGFAKSPPPERLLSNLSIVEDGPGITSFKRGMTTVFRDIGPRLDVQRVDDRDIEAALRLAAQKFDVDKGLLLTGDTAFKARAAEIAGRMGLKLRNDEPEVLAQWAKGRQQQAQLLPTPRPSVERGISGEIREPGIDRTHGDQLLVLDPGAAKSWGVQLEAAGVEFVATGGKPGELAIKLPGDRTLQALEAWRGMPYQTMQAFARADLGKPDGGLRLDEEDRKVLVHREMLREDGTITPAGVDVILVRDDHVLRSRVQPELRQVFAPGVELKTSHEFIRQLSGELQADRTHQTAGEATEKAKEQAQVKDLAKEQEQEREKEEPEARRPRSNLLRRRVQEADLGR